LALVAVIALFAAGCGGINGSSTVSPATFFMPGILKADPAPAGRTLEPVPVPVIVVAQVR